MVFKRRDRRSIVQAVLDFLWPRGGWTRAFYYVQHRLRRLPGSPERIARGIWAGVFTTFTPFYGLHFIFAALVSRLVQGNLLAALLSTFFGNPLTYIPIGVVSLQTGHFLLQLVGIFSFTDKFHSHSSLVERSMPAHRVRLAAADQSPAPQAVAPLRRMSHRSIV